MGMLNVEIKRARNAVFAFGNIIKARLNAFDNCAFNLIRILVKKAETKHADVWVGRQFRNHQIVILTGIDPRAVFAHRAGQFFTWIYRLFSASSYAGALAPWTWLILETHRACRRLVGSENLIWCPARKRQYRSTSYTGSQSAHTNLTGTAYSIRHHLAVAR